MKNYPKSLGKYLFLDKWTDNNKTYMGVGIRTKKRTYFKGFSKSLKGKRTYFKGFSKSLKIDIN